LVGEIHLLFYLQFMYFVIPFYNMPILQFLGISNKSQSYNSKSKGRCEQIQQVEGWKSIKNGKLGSAHIKSYKLFRKTNISFWFPMLSFLEWLPFHVFAIKFSTTSPCRIEYA